MEYKIRTELQGHSKDVRGISCNSQSELEEVATASRDKYSKAWAVVGSSSECTFTSEEHGGYVSAVIWIQDSLLATASQDGFLRMFNTKEKKLLSKIEAHSSNISCLTFSPASTIIVTGSWDKTAKVWQNNKCLETLKGHEAAVWCVAVVENEGAYYILTGAADKLVCLWNKDCCVQKFEGHTDAVRDLLVLGPKEFLSASNDASVKHWSITGSCLATYYGHENYVYSLARLPDGFASCGEDRTLRVWKFNDIERLRDAECVQTIFHPATSVWSVDAFTNGDIVTGASDGIARVFSRDPTRQAPEDLQMSFKEQIFSVEVSAKQQLGGVPVDKLPGKESLYAPGQTDGQTKMVREGTEVYCYSWSATSQQWEKIGTVVGANDPATAGKTSYCGKEYDYVFNVDIQEGAPPIKLPYNEGDDPYMAAQKFITDNELSQYFLDEIAKFVIKNSKWNASSATPARSGSFYDPFTGGNRYVPTSARASGGPGRAGDPFTGSGAYLSEAARSGRQPASKYFPHTAPVRLEQGNVKGIVGKLTEFNSKVDQSLQVSSDALQSIEGLALGKSVGNAENLLNILAPLIHWPDEFVFPVLDLIRLAVLDETFVEKMVASLTPDGVLELINKYFTATAGAVNAMLAARTVANLFATAAGTRLLQNQLDNIITSLVDISANCRSGNPNQMKQLQIATATALLNAAVFLNTQSPGFETRCSLIIAARSLLANAEDPEAQFRLVVAVGSLINNDESRLATTTLDFGPVLAKLKGVTDPVKLGESASSLLSLLGL